jgi:hypothetical protein
MNHKGERTDYRELDVHAQYYGLPKFAQTVAIQRSVATVMGSLANAVPTATCGVDHSQ